MKIGKTGIQQDFGKVQVKGEQKKTDTDKVVLGEKIGNDDLLSGDKLKNLQAGSPHYLPHEKMHDFERSIMEGTVAFTAGCAGGVLLATALGASKALPPWATMGLGGATALTAYCLYKGFTDK